MEAPSHQIRNRDWLDRAETRKLMSALDPDRTGNVARFVGGVVRDAFLGREIKDVDIATILTPDQVMQLLEGAGIKVIPTGIDHGTVTAVVDHMPFEITTLRHDVETFGRHARVAFTDDWAADAARRDFTMNALYCDLDGTVFDPVGGVDDLLASRVRFIGRAEDRIEEDALRILRFFRFQAWYGKGEADEEGLAASKARAGDLERLSAERVRDEILKLLAAPDPVPVLRLMVAAGIMEKVLPEAAKLDRLQNLVRLETVLGDADRIRRLGALLPDGAAGAGTRLRLSKREQIRLSEMIAPRPEITPHGSSTSGASVTAGDSLGRQGRVALYRLGREGMRDHALLNWAEAGGDPTDNDWAAYLKAAMTWPIPEFPVRGRDLIAAGMKPGPGLGDMLDTLETWWIARDFGPGKADLIERALKRTG